MSNEDSTRGTGGLSQFFSDGEWNIPVATGAFVALALVSGIVTLVGAILLTPLVVLGGAAFIVSKCHSPGRSTLFGTGLFVLITVVMALSFANSTPSLESGFGLILLPPVGVVLCLIGALIGSAITRRGQTSFDAIEEEKLR